VWDYPTSLFLLRNYWSIQYRRIRPSLEAQAASLTGLAKE
jgi:hypothetical protein